MSSQRLTLHELARLLKGLADHGYAHPEIGAVKELLDAFAREWDAELTAEQIGQVYGALSLVVPTGTVHTAASSVELDRAIEITSVDRGPDTLSKAMFRAWQNVLAAAKQEPAELVLMETGGLLVPDPRDKDLDGLSIADLFFLVAHDKLDGRPLLAGPVLACGVAAALLAELLLRGLVHLDLTSHQVSATTEPSKQVPGISAPVRQALKEIQDGRADTLGVWLSVLAAKGHLAVRRHLEQTGVVAREQRGRLQKKTYFVPVAEIVDSIFRVVTRPLHVRRMPTAPCAVLVEVAKATRLTVARHGEWLHVHDIPAGATLQEVPERERLDLLLALTRAEVTDLLTRP